MNKDLRRFAILVLAFVFMAGITLPHQRAVRAQDADTPTPEALETPYMLTAADVINAVNNLRIASGLNALSIHPVLMQVAAQQASALASSEGAVGHQRPCRMTLGQQLLSLGFPLWGDLSQDGYRSENWVMAGTVEEVMEFWQSDAEHLNTMISPNRSDIGAAVVVGDQIYVVLETALKTNSGQMQSTAYDILTGIPMTQTLCAGFASGEISDYSIPVIVSTARPDGDVIHEVQYGQTLWTLADMYHVTVEQIKLLNGLTTDTIVPGWKLLIQKAATQPAPVTDTPPSRFTPTETPYPTAVPYHSPTPSPTVTVVTVPLGEQIKQNRMVVAALLIAFSVLLAGIIGFGRKKEE
jgi:LysM repeat protein/uncharacterized protein YkwD